MHTPATCLGGRSVAVFGWIAAHRGPPRQWDLRRIGWTLSADPSGRHVRLIDARSGGTAPSAQGDPALHLFVGVDCGRERARLLDAGCGDALPCDIGLAELAWRARRVTERCDSVPRRRELGGLTLDLLHRDARAGDRWLALHPREFALLWRLAECPGERVSRVRLLREVWRLEFEPGTNSVEVHVSRLRAKLAGAGIRGLVETDPLGGYRVARREPARAAAPETRARPPCAPDISC
jgi:two-component system OmpR family response regulator